MLPITAGHVVVQNHGVGSITVTPWARAAWPTRRRRSGSTIALPTGRRHAVSLVGCAAAQSGANPFGHGVSSIITSFVDGLCRIFWKVLVHACAQSWSRSGPPSMRLPVWSTRPPLSPPFEDITTNTGLVWTISSSTWFRQVVHSWYG